MKPLSKTVFILILGYCLLTTMFNYLIPVGYVMNYVFSWMLAVLAPKLRATQLILVLGIQTITIYGFYLLTRDAWVFLNAEPMTEVFMLPAIFMLLLVTLYVNMWVVKRLKLRERIGICLA